MDSKAFNRRNLIKNIFIIFLVVLLFLTLFSNTIMNFSLPEVSAQYPSSGTITSRIRKSGNVMATEDYEVIIDETRNLLSVEVKKGDTVAIGDLLFTLEEGDSNELVTAIANYDDKKIAYEKKLLDMDKDYTDFTKAVNEASSNLSKLRNKKDNAGNEDELIKELNKQKEELEWEKSILTKQQPTGAKYDYSVLGKSNATVLADANKFYAAAKSDYEIFKSTLERAENDFEVIEDSKNEAQKNLDRATTELTNYEKEIGADTVTEESILTQKRAIEDMEIKRTRAIEELEIAKQSWQRSIGEAYETLTKANDQYYDALYGDTEAEGYDSKVSAAQQALQEAGIAYNKIQSTKPDAVSSKEISIEDFDRDIKRAKEDLAKDEQKFNTSQSSDKKLQTLKDAKNKAQSELDQITEQFNDATKTKEKSTKSKEEAEALMNGYLLLKLETEVKILEVKVKDIDSEISDLNNNKGETVTDVQIEAAEKALKTAQDDLNKARNDDNKNSEIEKLELDKLKKELDKLEADVERIQKNNIGTEIRAKVAGQINSINYTAGQEIKASSTIATIQIVDKGYYAQVEVTNEEATRIRPGETATVQYYWGSNITATVESILNSESSPGKSKTVRISIVGEIEVGRSLSFSLGERGQNYDTIVPKSAIREDSNGKFILTVVSKSTPLGNRYTAVRVDVTVLEEDDTNAAINLGLYGSEFVITTSTKPIKDGDQVRLVNR